MDLITQLFITPESSNLYNWEIGFYWGLGLIITGLFWKIYRLFFLKRKLTKKLTRAVGGKLIVFGFGAWFLVFVRLETITVLAWPFWWIIYGIILLGIFITTYLYIRKQYALRARIHTEIKEDPRQKYLPKSKGRIKKKK